MAISVLRLLGERVAHKTLAKHSHNGGLLDIKLGFSMLKDNRVPFRPKLLSVGLGAGLIALLIALELPWESVLSLVVPILGLAGAVLADGLEAVIGTLGMAAILLPHLSPKLLTQQIRNERANIIEEPITPVSTPMTPTYGDYDIPQAAPRLISPRS